MSENLQNQMPGNESEPIGLLFNSIYVYSSEQLNEFIDNLNEEQSHTIMKLACEKSLFSGIFTLEETEILLKSLRKTNKIK